MTLYSISDIRHNHKGSFLTLKNGQTLHTLQGWVVSNVHLKYLKLGMNGARVYSTAAILSTLQALSMSTLPVSRYDDMLFSLLVMGTLPDPRDTRQSTGVLGHRRRASCRASPVGLLAVDAPSWNLWEEMIA